MIDYISQLKKRLGNNELKLGVTADDYNSFFTQISDLSSKAAEQANSLNSYNGWKNSGAALQNTDQLRRKESDARVFLNYNRQKLGEEAYQKALQQLNNASEWLNAYQTDYKNASDYYSQWDSEEAYNAAMKQQEGQQKEYQRLMALDVEATKQQYQNAQKKLEELQAELTRANNPQAYPNQRNSAVVMNDIKQLEQLQNQYYKDYNDASQLQKSEKYNNLTKSQDFEKLAKQGLAIKSPQYKDIQGKSFVDELFADYDSVSDIADNSAMLTDEEKNIYGYLVATQGENAANEYLTSLLETINYRRGARQADNVQNSKLWQLAYAVPAGVDQFAGGIAQNFQEDRLPTSATQFASGDIREDLNGTGWQVGYDLLNTTANMAPSILLSSLITAATGGAGAPVAGAVGAAVTGTSARGNAINEALAEGYSPDQASAYGTLVGASEGALQYLLGGISKLGGKLTGNIAQKAVGKIDNVLLRVAADTGIHMAGEGAEEYLQEILTPVFRNIAFDENNELKLFTEEALYSGILGALSAGLMEGPSSISNAIINRQVTNANQRGELAGDIAQQMAQNLPQSQVSENYAAPQAEAAAGSVQSSTASQPKGQIDISKINGKSLNLVQKSSVNAIRKIAEVTGINFEFFESEVDSSGKRIGENGSYDPTTNTIRLDIEAGINNANAQNGMQQAVLRTTAHELTHYTKQWSPEKYRVLQDYVLKELNRYNDQMVDTLIVEQMDNALSQGKELSYTEALDEVIADSCEMMLKDSNAIQKLARRDLSLAQRIKAWIDRYIADIKKAFTGITAGTAAGQAAEQIIGDLSTLQKLWDDALEDAVRVSKPGQSTNADIKHSIRYTKDNKPVVVVEENILEGVPRSEWVKTVKQTISEKFSGGIPVSGRLVKVNQKTRNEFTGSKSSQRYSKNNSIVYEDKFKSANNLDEIVLASTNYINEDLKHQRKDNFKEFARGDVLIRVDDNDYSAKVIVGFTGNNAMVLYDVIDFAPVSFDLKTKGTGSSATQMQSLARTDSAVPSDEGTQFAAQSQNEQSSSNVPSTDTTVPQKEQSVNTSISENAKNDTKQQLRTDEKSNRELLAEALDTAAKTPEEKNKLLLYREAIGKVNQAQTELTKIRGEIKDLSFSKGKRDMNRLAALKQQASELEREVDKYDKRLLSLEATKPLKDLLEREKAKAFKKARDIGHQKLADMRQNRDMAELRRKINKTIGDIRQRVIGNTTEKHVPSKLMLFAVDLLEAVNVNNPETDIRRANKLAELQRQIAAEQDQEIRRSLQEAYDKLVKRDTYIKNKLDNLSSAYERIKTDENYLLQHAYDEGMSQQIQDLKEKIGNTPVSQMTREQLEAVYDTVKEVSHTILNANKMFADDRKMTVEQYGKQVISEIRGMGRNPVHLKNGLVKYLKDLDWADLKPIYAMRTIGSKTLEKLYHALRKGEDIWAVDVAEARSKFQDCARKYRRKNWNFEERFSFQTEKSGEIELDLDQMMSLYAYSKRKQADQHLEIGGFVYDKELEVKTKKLKIIPVTYEKNLADAHQLTKADLEQIFSRLTEEQTRYVDEMQSYLSKELAAKGNEVTLKMYDVVKFKDENYFPLKSANQYLYQKNESSADTLIKNATFTKDTNQHANNPIVLKGFTEVWAEHCNQMALYHGLILPLEDFNRVFNYQTRGSDKRQFESLRAELENAFGKKAEKYISQLIVDVNGGIRPQAGEDLASRGLSNFKKAAVFASASVVVQQPAAIGRATALIDPKYFIKANETKSTWDEVKKYAPVAIVKEMGYFDTNIGQSANDWITAAEYDGLGEKAKGLWNDKNYRDDVLTKAPAKADELTWNRIWSAVKAETKEKTGLSGEALLQKSGERFTEVIELTQVYDSVFSRSELMRSKSVWAKIVTAFMGEPTTSWNMIRDSVIQRKRGNISKAQLTRNMASVAFSIVLASALKSFVTAGRDDDEDKTYAEKYLADLTGNLADELNPIGMIPILRDFQSIFQGYDVERSDVALISDLKVAWDQLFSDKKSTAEKINGLAGAIGALFGIPYKNVSRDIASVINIIKSERIWNTTGQGIANSILNEFGSLTKGDELYYAILGKDSKLTTRLKESIKAEYREKGKTLKQAESAIESAIKSGLRDHDKRVEEAAKAKFEGDFTNYKRLLNEIVSDGFDSELVSSLIDSEASRLEEPENDRKGEAAEEKESSIYDVGDLNKALENNDTAASSEILADLLRVKTQNAKQKYLDKGFNARRSEQEAKNDAESTLKSQITKYWKPIYQEASAEEKAEIRRRLYKTGLYKSLGEINQNLSKK